MSIDKFAADNGINPLDIRDRLKRKDEATYVQGFVNKKAFSWRFRIPLEFRVQIFNKVHPKTEVEQVVKESENEPLHAEANTHAEVEESSPAVSEEPSTPSSSFKETPSPPDSIDRAIAMYPPSGDEQLRTEWALLRYAGLRHALASPTVSAGDSEESSDAALIHDPFKTV